MRRAVNVKATIPSAKIEEALKAQSLEDGSPATRAHIVAGLMYETALDNLAEANDILEGKDFKFDLNMELLDPQSERSAKVRKRFRDELL
jgi:hypothetical protein